MAFCGFGLLAILASAGAHGQIDASAAADRPDQSETLGEADSGPPRATAQDVLDALQKRRPLNVPILPASAQVRGREYEKTALYPEGWALVSKSGTLEDDGVWWTFVPDAGDEYPPLRLLPNATLEEMVRSSESAPSTSSFVVSGELTVFEGENLLLPRFAMRSSTAQSEPPALTRPDEPATPQVGGASGGEASANDVLQLLQEQSPRQQMIMPQGRTSGDRNDSRCQSRFGGHSSIPDGSPLVDRPGRLVAQGPWWTFAFESDHSNHPEPPMKLLPNMNVELMIQALDDAESGLVFVVSGEVAAFCGENYLLPRVVMRRISSGNLRK